MPHAAKALNPGDSLFNVDLRRGDEIGFIRMQWYDARLRVASFTPGYETSFPGDTPKWNPERDEWCEDSRAAARVFVEYLIAAYRDGWCYENYDQ